MAKFSGKGSMKNQTVMFTVPDDIDTKVKDGPDGQFVNLEGRLSMLPEHNMNREPQRDARLSVRKYTNSEGEKKDNSFAPYSLEILDKLKDCPSVPATNQEGDVYGKRYFAQGDLTVASSGGKAYGTRMKLDTLQPATNVPENAEQLHFEGEKADRAVAKELAKELAKEAKEAAKSAEQTNEVQAEV